MILDRLLERNLGEAIVAMDNFLAVHPHQINTDRLVAIRTDYQLMADYWRRGFKDPQLPQLYDNLLRRMYVLYANMASNYTMRHMPYLSSLFYKGHMTARDWSPQVVKEELESFVSDVALLDLEPPHTSESKRQELYARHHNQMVELFDNILTSGQWTDNFSKGMEELLLSPTVDANDQQLIVSSVMMSAMSYFDMAKFRMLVHVYQQTVDEQVRQRALIGWVFALDADIALALYPEVSELVKTLLEDQHIREELVELQEQMIYCMNAERDQATIQNEIMPDLIQKNNTNSPIRIDWVNEEELESLNDILHPNAAEERLERMEASYMKMIDMQKQGSDIYFGGFSQMKRFPFFNEMINWLMPFDMNHPGIQAAATKFKDNRFLKMMMKNGPFCDSDKYSFLLAFDQVVGQLPPSLRDMFNRGELIVQEVDSEEMQQPAYIRRQYLQDLYRFFRLFSQHDAFRNIFDREEPGFLFFASPIFSETPLEQHFNEVTAFLIKKKRLADAKKMLKCYDLNNRDFQYYMMSGYLGSLPEINYARAVELEPDNERALAGYARALFATAQYEKALEIYEKLLQQQPEKKSYLLNKAVCLTNLGQYEAAEKILFRLNYEEPDNENVNRVLAWTLTCDGKYEQAEKLYTQLISVEKPSADDLLNYGYCLWFSGSIDEAARCFRLYLKQTGQEKESILENETKLIHDKGITEAEMQMMLYVL